MVCEKHCSVDVVMEGGGIKGIALVGALAVLEDRGYRVINVAGTSAGSIVAALSVAGYSAAEMRNIITDVDFAAFMDNGPRWLPRYTRAGYNLLAHWGIYRGDAFLAWMKERLAARGMQTFGDIRRHVRDHDPGLAYPLRVVASDVTRGRMIVLPHDATLYGIDPDRLGIADAVRMSMSIPVFFRPVALRESAMIGDSVAGLRPRPGATCYIVDGAILSNFPIRIFDGPGMGVRPTFGIRLAGAAAVHQRRRIDRFTSYVLAIGLTTMQAADNAYLDGHTFLRTIEVDNLGVAATDFRIPAEKKAALYESGVAAARGFLETWDFNRWRELYREWEDKNRRQILLGRH